MRHARVSIQVWAAGLVLAFALAAAAQCNLGCSPCQGLCRGGCLATPVAHRSADACRFGGSFDMTGTFFETTEPPLRFWQHGAYLDANSGCTTVALTGAGGGRWVLASMWDATGIDGCFAGSRTVAESSFVDPRREGMPDHGSYYLVASVDAAPDGSYDFDRVTGAPGCTPADVPVRPVGGVTLPAHSGPCLGARQASWVSWGSNAVDCHYLDVTVQFDDPSPPWYGEAGRNAPPPLIAGYEVMFATAPTALPPAEPASSSPCSGGWRPVLDPSTPGRALGVVPWGRASATVAVPNSWGEDIWFATRLIYADPANPPGPYLPGGDPRIASPVSGHCGPIAVPLTLDIPLTATKDDGVPAASSVASGAPITYTIEVFNLGSATDGFLVQVDDVLPDCLDLSGFDPIADPSQVQVAGGRTVLWDPGTRALQIQLHGQVPPTGSAVITIRGLAAGPDNPACCNVAAATNCRYTTGTFDAETGGDTCTRIGAAACGTPPLPVTGLLAARRGQDVELRWDPPADLNTVAHNVWKVLSGDQTLIPLANRTESATRPLEIAPVCLDVPPATRACLDVGAVVDPPVLVYYQVRGACADGSEGTAHPF